MANDQAGHSLLSGVAGRAVAATRWLSSALKEEPCEPWVIVLQHFACPKGRWPKLPTEKNIPTANLETAINYLGRMKVIEPQPDLLPGAVGK